LYFPKSIILHTGGDALGATSTRSSSLSSAIFKASAMGRIPNCFPSESITLTVLALMRSLTLMGFSLMANHPPLRF